MLLEPVPNRECGTCHACCKLFTIIDPVLKKPPGVLCPHWQKDVGCSIYERRPGACRGHHCAWRRIEQLDDSWRPDRCNVYTEVKTEPNERFKHLLPDAPFALKFTILSELSAQRMDLLIALVASLVAGDVPVILAVAAPPGHMGGYQLLNAELKPLTADLGPAFVARFAQIHRDLQAVPPALVPLE